MIKKIFSFIKSRPGLTFLIFILSVITLVSIKPNFYLMGWDNYSSYFNLKTNIFRTFFATWREYRGLGVPSDAEVTDIFRQLFYWITSFILPENLLDQVYYIMALWIGVLSMYSFARNICKDIFNNNDLFKNNYVELFSTLVAFFYLFNLNTLSVFYSPIIPFTNRFYSLPLLLLVFLKFIKNKNRLNCLLLIGAILVASGCYITPTLIITSLIAFSIFFYFNYGFKKALIYITIFLIFNLFWLLPFLNYTIQKSSIVPLARTFIEINESTLNKNSSNFSFDKQIILYPSFVDIKFGSQNQQPFDLHPYLKDISINPSKLLLFIFPLLYLYGCVLLFKNIKHNKKPIWIPLWIVVFLFLSLKEYSIFGFVYTWLAKNIPFFNVIFRISDTKFHAYISFAGSIAAAYGLLILIYSLKQKKKVIITSILLLLIGLYCLIFRGYFNGNLIGFFSYTKIPDAYNQIADIVNQDNNNYRVLHLPFDQWQHYWRSFSWGYIGSSFFNFFINKPYVDKTFEPASLENSYLHSRINNLLDDFYRSKNDNQKDQLANEFLLLLQKTSTHYVIVDQSITSDIYVRNLVYDARQTYIKSKEIMDYLARSNKVILSDIYTINLKQLYSQYKNLYPVSKIGFADNLPNESFIYLYEVLLPDLPVEIVRSSKNIDYKIDNLLETPIATDYNLTVTQDSRQPAVIMPFIQQNHKITKQDNIFNLQYDNPNPDSLNYRIVSGKNTNKINNSYMIDVYAKSKNNKLYLSYYYRYYPNINDNRYQRLLDTKTFNIDDDKQYKIKLNDVFVDLPVLSDNSNTYITSYMIHDSVINTSLLEKTNSSSTPLNKFIATTPSVCYGPQYADYQNNMTLSENKALSLESKSGSTCVEKIIPALNPKSNEKTLIEVEIQSKTDYLGQEPTQQYVCLSEAGVPECLNNHRHYRLDTNNHINTISTNKLISDQSDIKIQIGLIPQQGIKQKLDIEALNVIRYSVIDDQTLSFDPNVDEEVVSIDGPINISFPLAQSLYSFIYNPKVELFDMSQNRCRGKDTNNRNLIYQDGLLVNTMDNCDMFFAQKLTYAFGYPYLLAYQYKLDSGQQPNILIGWEGDNYILEKASLYQGYPNLKGQLVYASRLFEPRAIIDTDTKDMSIHLTQDTANMGKLSLGQFDMIEYPLSWYTMELVPEKAYSTSSSISDISFSQILPSLWRVNINELNKDNIIIFNQGYDKQWGIYNNLVDVFFGQSQAVSYRCNGYANCFDLSNVKSNSLFIFYWPERLSFLGWILTILTGIFLIKFLTKDPLTNNK